MKKNILILGIFVFTLGLFSACGGNEENNSENTEESGVNKDEFLNELSALEDSIEANLNNPDQELLKSAITKYQDFADIFPDDPKAPDYLLKASDFSLATNQPQKSVKILNKIIENYPDYGRMEDVLFNKASHLDFELRDTTQAKEVYREFIEKYPNSELVDDAESRIQNISLSMEELVEKFMSDLENNPPQ